MTLNEMQEKYGKPTLEQCLSAYYTMMRFKEYIKNNDNYIHPHNFQLERSDIVHYIYCSHDLVKEIIAWDGDEDCE